MNKTTKASMINYLESIIELEKAKYEQEQIIANINNRISCLNNPKLNVYQSMPIRPEAEMSTPSLVLYTIGLTVALIIVLNLPIISKISLITTAAVIFYILCIIVFISIFIEHLADIETYEGKCDSVAAENLRIEKDNNSIISENKLKVSKLRKDLNIINSSLKRTKSVLHSYYAINVLYPKYQNWVAVASILEYYQAGVCHKLEDVDGAYNKYDQEVLLKTIICSLGDILANLEEIKNNQYLLYKAITGSNRNINYMMNRLLSNNEMIVEAVNQQGQTISGHLSAIEYNNTVMRLNTTIMSDFEMFQFLSRK